MRKFQETYTFAIWHPAFFSTIATPSIAKHYNMFLCYLDCIRAPPRRGMDWEIHPRRPRFPETREISRGRSPREISRVEGNLGRFPAVEGCKTHDQGKSRGRRGWISQSIPSLGGARTFSHHYQGRIDFNTDNLIPKHMR